MLTAINPTQTASFGLHVRQLNRSIRSLSQTRRRHRITYVPVYYRTPQVMDGWYNRYLHLYDVTRTCYVPVLSTDACTKALECRYQIISKYVRPWRRWYEVCLRCPTFLQTFNPDCKTFPPWSVGSIWTAFRIELDCRDQIYCTSASVYQFALLARELLSFKRPLFQSTCLRVHLSVCQQLWC